MPVESKIDITANDKGVSATINRITKNFNEAERNLKGFGGGISSTLGSLSSFLNPTVAVSAAVSGVVTGLGYMVKSSIDTADKIYNMAQKVGISTEELSLLNYVAEMSDVDLESLGTTIAKLNRNISDSSKGQGEASKAFRALGIDVKNVNGDIKTADIILMEIAERFQYLPDGPQKTALAMELMGRSAANMIPFLNLGAEGIEKLKKEAKELGLEISEEMGERADSFNDKVFRLEKFVRGTAQGIAEDLLPALESMADWFYDNRGFIVETISETVKELNVLGFLLQNPSDANILNFMSNGFDMVIPKAIRKTDEEMKVLKNEIMYVVDAAGKVQEIVIVSDADLEKRKLAKLIEDTEASERAAKKLQEQWDTTSLSLNRDMAVSGLNEFDTKLFNINSKVEDLYKKFGNKPLIKTFGETLTNAMVSGMVNDSIAESIAEEEVLMQEQMSIMDTDLLHAIDVSMQKRDLIYEEMEIRREQIEDEINLQMMREQGLSTSFGNMARASEIFYQLGGKQAKAAFVAYKAFSIAEAIMSTYSAATAALKPPPIGLGPVWGIPLAVSTVALGLANVARISSASPGNSSGGGISSNYNPTLPSNNYNNDTTNNSQNISITLYTNNSDPDEIIRTLIPALEKYNKYGGSINIK